MAEEGVKIVISAEDQASNVVDRVKESFSVLEAKIITAAAAYALVKEAAALAKEVFEATAGKVLDFAEGIEKINIAAEGLGLTADAYKKLQDASYLLTGSSDTLNSSLLLMGRNLGMAATGAGPAAKALEELGINAQLLAGMKLDDQFIVLAEALGTVSNQSEKLRDEQALFSRGFREIIPMLADGGQAFVRARDEAAKLSYMLSPDLVEKSVALAQKTRELDLAWQSMSVGWKTLTIGPMTEVVELLGKMVEHVKEIGSMPNTLQAISFLINPGGTIAGAIGAAAAAKMSAPGFFDQSTTGAWGSFGSPQSSSSALDKIKAQSRALEEERANAQAALDDAVAKDDAIYNSMQDITAKVGSSAKELFAELPGGIKKLMGAFGFDSKAMGGSLDSVAGNMSDMTGMNVSGAGLGGAIGIGLALLMQNPLFQADMKRLMDMVEQLITPLVESISPSLDALAPVMTELKPIFQIIGESLRIYLAPMVIELHAVAWALKPVSDALTNITGYLDKLASAIENWNPFGGGGGGMGGSFLGSVSSALGFADGGTITPNRMLTRPDAKGGGLVYAHVGETVNPRGGSAGHTFNVYASDPRAAAQATRQMLEELSLQRSLAVA